MDACPVIACVHLCKRIALEAAGGILFYLFEYATRMGLVIVFCQENLSNTLTGRENRHFPHMPQSSEITGPAVILAKMKAVVV